jgi:epimerase transport system membrane fusion protein
MSIYLADREKDMRTRLSELEPKVKAAEQSVAAAASQLHALVVKAPVDGQVINVKVKSAGEVVSPGMVLMELVPTRRDYFVEAKISVAEIENVRAGMPAEITFISLPAKATPYVDGRLTALSSNSTANEKTGEEYYIATVDFRVDVSRALGMQPTLGMPVQVLLKGGRRSVMSYLVEPFRSLMRKAMKES